MEKRLGAGEKPRRAERPPEVEVCRIVIVDGDEQRAQALARGLRAVGTMSIVSLPHGLDGLAVIPLDADVGVIELGACNPYGFTWASTLASRGAEIVFFASDAHCVQVVAARNLGISRILPTDDLGAWLSRAVSSLTRCVRARRVLAETLLQIPPVPGGSVGDAIPPLLSLSVAEQQF